MQCTEPTEAKESETREAETALLTLGRTLSWEPNTFVVSEVVSDAFDFFPGEIARTAKGTYVLLRSCYLPQVSLAGVLLTVDVTFHKRNADGTPGDREFPPSPFADDGAARAACECHYAIGNWE